MATGAVPPQAVAIDGLVGMVLTGLQLGLPILTERLRGLLRSLVAIQLIIGAFAWMASYLSLATGIMASILRVAVFTTLLGSFPYLTNAMIDYFIWGGLTLGGIPSETDVMTVEEFKRPSTVVRKAFDATRPIITWANQQMGKWWNPFSIGLSTIAMVGIWLTFVGIAVHLIWVLMATYVGAAFATLFVPFGALEATSFLAMRGVSMVVEGAARLGFSAMTMALIFPFVDSFFLTNTPEQNLDMAGAFWLWVGALLVGLLNVGLPGVVLKMLTGVALGGAGLMFPGMGTMAASAGGAASQGFQGMAGGMGRQVTGGAPPPRAPRVERNTSAGYEFY